MTTLILRIAAVLCLILALAGLYQKHQKASLAVAFLLDISDSVPTSQQQAGIDKINAAAGQLKPTDLFTVIPFAAQASIGLPLRSKIDQPNLSWDLLSERAIDPEATDIAGALQLAMHTLPDDRRRRIVLLSDGLQNVGDLNELLDLVRASGIEVFTIPLNSEREDEVWVRELRAPTQVKTSQTFPLRAIIESGRAQQVRIHLYRDDRRISEPEPITLKPGKQEINLPLQRLVKEGTYKYQLKILVNDTIPQNNEAYAFVRVQGQPHALYVEGDERHANHLESILESSGFAVNVITPTEFPTDLVNLQSNDVTLMSNVSADDLSESQMVMIDSYVRDLGKGLVVIGGDRAFGRGGYHDTPLERVLPLEMTPRQRKESLALMFVIDTSGSMANYVGADQKIQLAIEGIRAGVRELDDEDKAGVIGFTTKIEKDISPTTDHEMIIREVGGLIPTGGTKMYPALKRAHDKLKAVDAKQKHIILLSDGRSDGDFNTLAEEIAADQIYVTAIAIGDAAQDLMQTIAELGQGNYVPVQNVSQLPKILADEVRQTQKYTIQETFQPIITEVGSTILAGIIQLPRLHGYIATSEKEYAQVYIRSHEEHPILAAWSYGLGRSVAFTSDVKPGWAAEWIEWEQFGKFWGQVVNWVEPSDNGNADFDLYVSRGNGVGQVVIDTSAVGVATDVQTFDVRVARPKGAGEAIEMQQTTPTQYKGEFSIGERGAYSVTAQRKRGEVVDGSRQASFALSYPAEFAEFAVNRQLLNTLANRTNGIYEPTPKQIAQHAGKPVEGRKPLAHTLLVAAIPLFVLEMIFRRLSIASGYLAELRTQLATFRRSEEATSSATLSQLSDRKAGLAQTTRATSIDRRTTRDEPVVTSHESVAGRPQSAGSMGRLLLAKQRARAEN